MTNAWLRSDCDECFVARHATAQLLLWSGFYYLFPALLTQIVTATGWSDLRLSAALTMGCLVWAGLSPLAGALIDRGAGRPATLGAGLLGGALLLILAATRIEDVALVVLVLLGLPMAMTLYDPCFALILRQFGAGPRASAGITMVTLVAGFATLLTFAGVGGLVRLGLGWRSIVVTFAVAVFAAVAMVPADVVRPASRPRPRPAEGGKTQLGQVSVLGLAFGLVIFAHTVLLFQVPTLLARTWLSGSALYLPMVLGPSQVAGRLVWRQFQHRVPQDVAALWLFAGLLVPPLLMHAAGGRPALILLALILQGAGYGIQTILRPGLVVAWFAGATGRRLGLVAMIGLVLMALGPVSGSAAALWGGFDAVMALAGLAVGLALVCLLVAHRAARMAGGLA